ncbi:hypothetical protein LUZ60_007448 [Juncus effusus]|nr:hypothetical protein LUZ60_007448 [Juncus effusus]
MSLYTNLPGYRFYPTEEELLGFYLQNKLENTHPQDIERFIPVLDVYNHHPSDLPSLAGEANKTDSEQWFFFCARQEKEAQGGKQKRTTFSGYWKATGSPSYVFSSRNKIIGVKRTMVFYQGRAPNGAKTNWKMNEYKLLQHDLIGVPPETPQLRQEFSLCRVYIRTATLRSFDRRPLNTTNNTSSATENSSFRCERNNLNGSSSSSDFHQHLNSEEMLSDWNFLNDLDLDFNRCGTLNPLY